jgi:hypothetical protein
MTLKRTSLANPGGTREGNANSANANNNKALDPAQEEMLDRLFDLYEMEAFADKEDEMLPVDASSKEDN